MAPASIASIFLIACSVGSVVLILFALATAGRAALQLQRRVKRVEASIDGLHLDAFEENIERLKASAERGQVLVARTTAAVARIATGIQDLRSQLTLQI